MRVLIVEDEKKIAAAIKKGLEQESFAVDVVHDGESGLAEMLNEDFDVVILDIMLPKKDGIEVLKEIRKKGKSTPILILTAKGSVNEKVSGLYSGADDYLAKPFAFEELLARVRALLRRPQRTLNQKLVYKDVALDTTNHVLMRDSKVIKLSAKEFSLLEYLIRNTGKTCSKEAIRNHVWDFDADILPNTIEAHVGYLRAKIDRPFKGKEQLINTVRGFGYRFGDMNG